jgi:light-regulated signal transduction histidine kinase (bacteriophytochrome)
MRKKALDSMAVKTKAQAEAEQVQQETEKKVDQVLSAPTAKPVEKPAEKQYKAVFEVIGSLDQLKAVKAFLEENGVKYVTR